MIVLSTMIDQTLQPGQSITFTNEIIHCGNNECHRNGSSAVKLRAPGIYDVRFSASISSTDTGVANLAIQLGGETLVETLIMQNIATADDDIQNVATSTYVKNQCGDYDRITITNIGTIPITIEPGANLNIRRVCG